jgi:hypothetical protein
MGPTRPDADLRQLHQLHAQRRGIWPGPATQAGCCSRRVLMLAICRRRCAAAEAGGAGRPSCAGALSQHRFRGVAPTGYSELRPTDAKG